MGLKYVNIFVSYVEAVIFSKLPISTPEIYICYSD